LNIKERTPQRIFTFNVIFPALLLGVFLSFTGVLATMLKHWLWLHSSFAPGVLQEWKGTFFYPVAATGGILVILLSLKYPAKTLLTVLFTLFALLFLSVLIIFSCFSGPSPEWLVHLFSLIASLWFPLAMILYWGFLNDNFHYKAAIKFYPFLATVPVVGMLAAQFLFGFLKPNQFSSLQESTYLISSVLLLVTIFAFAALGVLCIAYKRLATFSIIEEEAPIEKKSYLFYLVMLFGLIVVASTLVNLNWRDLLKHTFTDMEAYSAFLGNFAQRLGVVSIIFLLGIFVVPLFFKWWGWTWVALVVPVVLTVMGGGFYITAIWGEPLKDVIDPFGRNPMEIALGVGSAFIIFEKAAQSVLIFAPQEIAILPLKKEWRLPVRLAIGIFVLPIAYQGTLFFLSGNNSLIDFIPYMGAVVIVALLLLITTIVAIGKQIGEKSYAYPVLEDQS
jgi:ATP/ADP translocase